MRDTPRSRVHHHVFITVPCSSPCVRHRVFITVPCSSPSHVRHHVFVTVCSSPSRVRHHVFVTVCSSPSRVRHRVLVTVCSSPCVRHCVFVTVPFSSPFRVRRRPVLVTAVCSTLLCTCHHPVFVAVLCSSSPCARRRPPPAVLVEQLDIAEKHVAALRASLGEQPIRSQARQTVHGDQLAKRTATSASDERRTARSMAKH